MEIDSDAGDTFSVAQRATGMSKRAGTTDKGSSSVGVEDAEGVEMLQVWKATGPLLGQ